MSSNRFAAGLASRILRCALLACVLHLCGCTIQFTPGDARPAGYTPYGMPGGYGDWWDGSPTRGSAGTPPQ